MFKNLRIFWTKREAAMSKEFVLILGLLAILAGWAQATEGHSIYGVKLCGREFIRAVIFTCGGSRWRRSVGTLGKPLITDLYPSINLVYDPFPIIFKDQSNPP